MGCDIHLHQEIKVNGKWLHYGRPDIDRNYWLFGRMAGVRGDAEPLAYPRGLPDDATETTRFCSDYDGPDGHSHSWLSSKEVAVLEREVNERRKSERGFIGWEAAEVGYLFGNSWDGFYEYRQDYPKQLEDFRFVFWFDN